jgi:hypothetical protein
VPFGCGPASAALNEASATDHSCEYIGDQGEEGGIDGPARFGDDRGAAPRRGQSAGGGALGVKEASISASGLKLAAAGVIERAGPN